MHNSFFGSAKKATYLFETKLILLTSELFLILAPKIWFFSEKATYVVFLPRDHAKKATRIAFLDQNSICISEIILIVTEKSWFFLEKALNLNSLFAA